MQNLLEKIEYYKNDDIIPLKGRSIHYYFSFKTGIPELEWFSAFTVFFKKQNVWENSECLGKWKCEWVIIGAIKI